MAKKKEESNGPSEPKAETKIDEVSELNAMSELAASNESLAKEERESKGKEASVIQGINNIITVLKAGNKDGDDYTTSAIAHLEAAKSKLSKKNEEG